MPYFRRMVFMKTLDPSICAPARSGPQTRRPSFDEQVGEPRRQRGLGADHGEVDLLRRREIPQPVEVVHRQGNALRSRATPGLPGAA